MLLKLAIFLDQIVPCMCCILIVNDNVILIVSYSSFNYINWPQYTQFIFAFLLIEIILINWRWRWWCNSITIEFYILFVKWMQSTCSIAIYYVPCVWFLFYIVSRLKSIENSNNHSVSLTHTIEHCASITVCMCFHTEKVTEAKKL